MAHLRYGLLLRNASLGWAAPKFTPVGDPQTTPHPWWGAHQLIADGMLASILALADALGPSSGAAETVAPSVALREPLSRASVLRQYEVCTAPLAVHSARASFASRPLEALAGPEDVAGVPAPRARTGGWLLREDRPGKPGWIGVGEGATIEFALRFGELPHAMLSYLRGYDDDFGELKLQMLDVRWEGWPDVERLKRGKPRERLWEKATAMVDTKRTDGVRVTQAAVLTMNMADERIQDYAHNSAKFPRHFAGIVGFGLPPRANATLRATAVCRRTPRCRVKIMALTSGPAGVVATLSGAAVQHARRGATASTPSCTTGTSDASTDLSSAIRSNVCIGDAPTLWPRASVAMRAGRQRSRGAGAAQIASCKQPVVSRAVRYPPL